jgi:hypothetical protein
MSEDVKVSGVLQDVAKDLPKNEIKEEPSLYKEILEENQWFHVQNSSNISRFRYLKEQSTLVIQFSNSGTYSYKGVSTPLIVEFIQSPSKGKFFFARIKKVYPGIKLDPAVGDLNAHQPHSVPSMQTSNGEVEHG